LKSKDFPGELQTWAVAKVITSPPCGSICPFAVFFLPGRRADTGSQMRNRQDLLVIFAVAFALGLTSQAEAAKARKHKKSDRQSFGAARPYYPGGVMAGPLYNGQDYLGNDPDPNIRAYLMKDKTRYGGSR
jgi:hypothetical protein